METTVFEDFGLSQGEIKTFLAILQEGSSGARILINKTGLQSSVVYRALDRLVEKGLVGYILEGKRRIYQSRSPEQFLHFIDDKKKEYEELIPKIKQLQTEAKEQPQAMIYKGIRGIKETYQIMRETEGKEYLTFGGGKPCEDLLGTTWWINHHKKRIARKLPARQVYDKTVEKIGRKLNKEKLTKVRFLDKKFAQFQETVIVGNKVAITVFTKNPYSFLIEDNIVAEGYRKHFEILWNESKKIRGQSPSDR